MISYSDLNKTMSSYVPTDFVCSTLTKLACDSRRLLGDLHANSFELGSVTSYGTSRNNSYGNAVEGVFSAVLKDRGWNIEKTKYYFKDYDIHTKVPSNKKSIAIDQVFSNDDYYIFIEQKIRDDHDTSKAPGQFENYELKFRILNEIIKDKKVIGIMWMIDNEFSRNKKFYENDEHMGKMNREFPGRNYLVYGDEIDNVLNHYNGKNDTYYDTFRNFLDHWRLHESPFPDLNFDKYSHAVSNALDSMNEKEIRELFTNKLVLKEAFPIIFPNKESLRTYRDQLKLREKAKMANKKDKVALSLLDDIL